MQAELKWQREKVAALTNSYDLLQRENKMKDFLIRDQAERLNKLEGDQSSLLGQHIGVLVDKNVLKENLAKNELTLTNLQNEVVISVEENKRIDEELEKTR